VSASLAQLLIPALEADADGRFTSARARFEEGLALGVGGFLLYGGETDAVRALTKEAQQRARRPLLFAADLERGAGQQFSGATGLPPLAAIAWLDDMEALRRAARHTAREARTMGVNWNLAPVVDLDVDAQNPIVGTRSFGADPERVARYAAAWIEACQAEGVLACAKHFPGHGRTATDSHLELPVVRASREELYATDLVPFRAAIAANVASLMTAHVAYRRSTRAGCRRRCRASCSPGCCGSSSSTTACSPPTRSPCAACSTRWPTRATAPCAPSPPGATCCSRRATWPPPRRRSTARGPRACSIRRARRRPSAVV
jgi:beta-glucosidase-like glycosyl hydrolase